MPMTTKGEDKSPSSDQLQAKAERGWFQRTSSALSRWIGPIGIVLTLVLGLIGFLASWHFYNLSQRERSLVYAVNPVYTRIVTAGQSTELNCFYGGTELGNVDITAVQVAIWNSGEESIREDNILEDIRIVSDPSVRILDVSMAQTSRPVINFEANTSPDQLSAGIVPLSWRILETGDGASVQLIYVGKDDVGFRIEGVVEGVKEVRCILSGSKVGTGEQQLQEENANRSAGWIMIGMGVVFCVFIAYCVASMRERIRRDKAGRVAMVCAFFFGVCIIIVGVYGLLSAGSSALPPFGFS